MSKTSTTDWQAREVAETAKRKASIETQKTALIAALKSLSIANVTIEYDGEGDSGQVNDMTARKADNSKVALNVPYPTGNPDQSETLETALDAFTWDVLYLHHDGFENNDGGYGELVIDVAAGTVDLSHYDRFVDSVFSGTEI